MSVSFDIRSQYGLFRPPYMTTSIQTLSIIPPTAVYGMLGAILGVARNPKHLTPYMEVLQGNKISIERLAPEKIQSTIVKKRNGKSAQYSLELVHRLVDPAFRIFVKGPIEDCLFEAMARPGAHFPLFMGVAHCRTYVFNPQRFKSIPVHTEYKERCAVDTAVVFKGKKNFRLHIDWREGSSLPNVTMVPLSVAPDRQFGDMGEIFYTRTVGEKVSLKNVEKCDIDTYKGKNIFWFPEITPLGYSI